MSGAELTFYLVAPVAILGALGLVFFRKAVHSALSMALTMVCLAVLYIAQEAPFMGVVQVVVYTGAVMMLFLFVIMLVGVDSSDSLVETIKGQRVGAFVLVVAMGGLLVKAILAVDFNPPVGLANITADGNVYAIAERVFGRYVFVLETLSALLITAAIGAMVLSHRERVERRATQREMARARFRPVDGDMSMSGPLPPPGTYARHNAVDTPALLPDGTPAELSLSRVLIARGATLGVPSTGGDVAAVADGSAPPPSDQGITDPEASPVGSEVALRRAPADSVPADSEGGTDR